MPNDFEREFLAEVGFDPSDPQLAAALEDAEAHMRLVETLVGVRKNQDIKQHVVAKRMETTQSRVSNFERIGGDPRLSTILRYARAVDAKVRMVVSPTPRGWTAAATTYAPAVATSAENVRLDGTWERVSLGQKDCG